MHKSPRKMQISFSLREQSCLRQSSYIQKATCLGRNGFLKKIETAREKDLTSVDVGAETTEYILLRVFPLLVEANSYGA